MSSIVPCPGMKWSPIQDLWIEKQEIQLVKVPAEIAKAVRS